LPVRVCLRASIASLTDSWCISVNPIVHDSVPAGGPTQNARITKRSGMGHRLPLRLCRRRGRCTSDSSRLCCIGKVGSSGHRTRRRLGAEATACAPGADQSRAKIWRITFRSSSDGDRGRLSARQPTKSSGRTSSAASGDSRVSCAHRPSRSSIAPSSPMR
jgi:hypothetical protein